MKKRRINGEFALFIALNLLALGMVFVIKAGIGVTVVQAPVLVLGESLPELSIGTWNYIVQGSLFVLMLLIIRRVKVSYLISFFVGILYGILLDFFIWVFAGVSVSNLFMVILFYIIGFIILCIAVSLFFVCRAPLMPYDIFIREVAKHKNVSITKFKWGYDIASVTVALIISLTLNGRIIGLGIGTLIFALFVSPVMSLFRKFFLKYFEFVPFVKDKFISFKKK